MTKSISTLEVVLNGLMKRYKERVSDVQKIIDLMIENQLIKAENEILNDHIAFRTLGLEHLGIASLEKIFLHYGYQKKDAYEFPQKKLKAFWFAPPLPHFPRIFISQLMVDQLSEKAQSIINKYTRTIKKDPVDALNLNDASQVDNFLHSPLWQTPTLEDYQYLEEESEYAAWVIYNRLFLNHFTISIHQLPKGYNTIEDFNRFLEINHLTLNNSGGKLKISHDGLLKQSSTIAGMIKGEFIATDGSSISKTIPGSYVEFAERDLLNPNDNTSGKRREGFEANNANHIFESTYKNQTQRKN
ncbi:MAG: DUF1338 domain-containing protein [Bacteroidales bacterium]|nr:DUF1338 domain-containing protein [Bacteroidales bacterium]